MAEDLIKLFNIVTNTNKIETLLADQYSSLNAKKFKDYIKNKNINLIFTAVENPQSNGMIERLNQTITNRIRCKINDDNNHRPWTKIAESCVLRNTTNQCIAQLNSLRHSYY